MRMRSIHVSVSVSVSVFASVSVSVRDRLFHLPLLSFSFGCFLMNATGPSSLRFFFGKPMTVNSLPFGRPRFFCLGGRLRFEISNTKRERRKLVYASYKYKTYTAQLNIHKHVFTQNTVREKSKYSSYTHAHTDICKHSRTNTYTHTHTCTHAHTCTCAHTHTHRMLHPKSTCVHVLL